MTQMMLHCNLSQTNLMIFYLVATRAKVEVESKFPLRIHQMEINQIVDNNFNVTVNCVQRSGSKQFTRKNVKDFNLVHDHGKVYVPRAARECVLKWYHHIIVHPEKD